MKNLGRPAMTNANASGMALLVVMVVGLAILNGTPFLSRAIAQAPTLSTDLPYRVAVRHPLSQSAQSQSDRWPNFGALLDAQKNSAHRIGSPQRSKPHPAVARIIVPEGAYTAYGSGTLIDVRERYGLVVTNWHVVHDATEAIEVVFPGGFRSQARALKVDSDWDLAALVIWRPPVEPVTLADRSPRPGDRLTIHGYGKGKYRVATGTCTQFYAPRPNYPQEMVELDVEARKGDSGGPILNDRGELAGVLFGAGQGTTIGSFGRRVESFLATLAPNIGDGNAPGTMIAAAEKPMQSAPKLANQGRLACTGNYCQTPVECGKPAGNSWQQEPQTPQVTTLPPALSTPATPQRANQYVAQAEASPWQSVDANRAQQGHPSTAGQQQSPNANQPAYTTPQVVVGEKRMVDHAKSVLAIVGLFTVCVLFVRVVT